MPLAKLYSAAFFGLDATLVEIEIDLSHSQTSQIRIIGLPDAAVKESKDRVMQALKNNGHRIDQLNCIIHLAPAEIKKVGAFYDLPIAIGILHAAGIFRSTLYQNYLMGGELSLTGEVRPVVGALSLALFAKKLGKKGILIPTANVEEASLVPEIDIVPISQLSEAIEFCKNGTKPSFLPKKPIFTSAKPLFDMSEIKGQAYAKRALEIAAAGSHNVLLSGPPGTGKSMLSKAFLGILPPLTYEEALEVTQIHSLMGHTNGLAKTRPFRAPHHTISHVSMVGGGSYPKPGEISLAHHGVLFLDELPEFSRTTLEALRQPLEDHRIHISRAGGKMILPTKFIFIAAMNPCPCGYYGHPNKPCQDTSIQIARYKQKISGPLLDRIDIKLTIPPPFYSDLLNSQEESSEKIRAPSDRGSSFIKERIKRSPLFAKTEHRLSQINARSHPNIQSLSKISAASTQSCPDNSCTQRPDQHTRERY